MSLKTEWKPHFEGLTRIALISLFLDGFRLFLAVFSIYVFLVFFQQILRGFCTLILGWCRWDIGIFPKSSQRRGTRGCRNLGLRDLDSRNERIRIIAFQNIQKFSNRPSKNIFAGRWKFMENRKNPKFSSLTELFDAYAGSQQKFMFKSCSDRYKKCQVKVHEFICSLRFILFAIYLI